MAGCRARIDTLRSLGFAAISGAYAPVGTPFTERVRLICITNNTEGDMIFSDDSTNAAGKLFIAAGSFKLFDVTSNINPEKDDKFVLPIGTQFYVKQLEAPTSGAVYIEAVY